MILRTFISKQEVQTLDIIRFDGEIEVVDSREALKQALDILSYEEYVGFDTETKPSFRKGEYYDPAIIQFSTLDQAFLIRVQRTGYTKELIDFLENPQIKKIGISIRDDLKDLQKVRHFEPNGFIDLNKVAQRLSITQIGVRSLVGIFLNRRVSKSQQTSNWENEVLTPGQQRYAATDAWVCIKIYTNLMMRGFV